MQTTPVAHSLCDGDISYEAFFEGVPVDLTTTPVAYDAVARSFAIYSEDFNLIGTRAIEIKATLIAYPTIVTDPPVRVDVEVIDPCINPVLSAPPQTSPPLDKYTGTTISKSIDPYSVDPLACLPEMVYSC